MELLEFLEKIADNTHYHEKINQWISQQPEKIKMAFHTNNSCAIKEQFSKEIYIANPSDIAQL